MNQARTNADRLGVYDVDYGRLGVDGLKRMLTFPPIGLTEGTGATYYRTRVVPFDCTPSRVVVAPMRAIQQVSVRLTVVRTGHRVTALDHDCGTTLPPLGFTLHAHDVLELAVHDCAERERYWSNRGGRWLRIFGALLVLDRLAVTP